MPEPTFDPALPDPSPSGPEKVLRPPRSAWDSGGDRSHVKTFVLAAGLMAAIGLGALAVHADVAAMWRQKFGPPLTSDETRARIATCERDADFACAQATLAEFLKRNPDDGVARAHLGPVMHHRAGPAVRGAVAARELRRRCRRQRTGLISAPSLSF